MHATSIKVLLQKKVFISLLLGLMVFTSFSFSTSVSAMQEDITPPAYVGSSSYSGNNVRLNFDEAITINSGDVDANTYLRSQMSIATDGINFIPLYGRGAIQLSYSKQIYLTYYDELKVISGTKTLIKIASGTLKDAAGNLNEEMILDVTPPVLQSTEISNDNHDVTITFHEEVIEITGNELKDYIYLLKNNDQVNWAEGDTVSIESGKLILHFEKALTGANNRVIIDGWAFTDSYGNIEGNSVSTPFILINSGDEEPIPTDNTAPIFLDSYLSNNNQDIVVVFDEEVLSNKDTEESLKAHIKYINPATYYWENIPVDSTVTFSGKKIIIHFNSPLFTGNNQQTRVSFEGNTIKDSSGNVIQSDVYVDYMYRIEQLDFESGYFSHSGQWLNLDFNKKIADNTLVDGISNLKEKIMISLNRGITYSALGEQDVVYISGKRLVVQFHDPVKSGTVKVKIEADALSDLYKTITNKVFEREFAYNTPDITGYFLSNTASEFLFKDNEDWRSKVNEVLVWNEVSGQRPLNNTEYTLTAGKLTINSGVFQKNKYNEIFINAEGYSSKYIEGIAKASSELFYMTTPVLTKENGINASISVLKPYTNYNDEYYNNLTGNQTVLFQLMNGTTPVSIVTANLKIGTGTYSAHFNVSDAATNANYTVKAFIINKFNMDFTNVGINMATQVTQAEFDLKQIESDYRKDQDDR